MCKAAALELSGRAQEIENAIRGVERVRQNMSYTITTQLFAERPLCAVNERLVKLKALMTDLSEHVATVSALYANAENEAVLLMNV